MVGLAIIHIEFFTHSSQDVQCVNFIATMTMNPSSKCVSLLL